jgi:hypothetical protein
MTETLRLTPGEERFCEAIRAKDLKLRSFLGANNLVSPIDANQWLHYLTGIKHALGNLNNDLGFVATLLIKTFADLKLRISMRLPNRKAHRELTSNVKRQTERTLLAS